MIEMIDFAVQAPDEFWPPGVIGSRRLVVAEL
jgi:hypothetical protein